MDNKTDIYSTSPANSSFTKNYNASVESRQTNETKTDNGVVKKNVCSVCNKKLGLIGFKCKCGKDNCSIHRYPESHPCTHDWIAEGKQQISQKNPVVAADKINNRLK